MTNDDNKDDFVAEDETIDVKTPAVPEKNPSFAVEEISDPKPIQIAQTQSPIGDQSPIDDSLVPDDPSLYEGQQLSESWLKRNKRRVIVGIAFLLLTLLVVVVTIIIILNEEEQDFIPTAEPVELFGRRFDQATAEIFLSQSGLEGSIPSTIGSLTALIYLHLWGNALTGTIPTELGILSNLKSIYLNDNELTGPIPSEIGLLSNLKGLDLGNNELTGPIPSEIGLLSNLVWLDLSDNKLTGPIPSEIGLFSNLKELYLKDNKLTGPIPSEIGLLSNLKELYLNNNELTGPIPSEIGLLTLRVGLGFRLLHLSKNNLSGSIPFSFCELYEKNFQTFKITVDCEEVICHCCGYPPCTQHPQPSVSTFPSAPPTTSASPTTSSSPSLSPSKSQMPTGEPVIVLIEFKLDGYPSDTGWNITDVDNDVIYEKSFNTYTQPRETVQESVLLTPGLNYTFHLLDSCADGLNGRVVIYLGDEPSPNTILGYYDAEENYYGEFSIHEIPFLVSEEGIIENIFPTASPSISQYPSNSFRPSEMPVISPPPSSPPSKSTLQEETKTAPTSRPSGSV